jgi:rhamnogalacturonyl hydrolase YesR
MVPPFLAYYGVTTGNKTLLQDAHTQIKLYRDALRDSKSHSLWKHVVQGTSGNDEGHWATGNAWAAAGMLRVAATIKHSSFSDDLKDEYKDLINWTKEIHGGMYRHLRSDGLFTNYVDNTSTFTDAAGATLLAASVYRISNLADVHDHVSQAEQTRKAIAANGHIDSNGWLTPVVNPHAYGEEGSQSPEGQAFVLQMQAAYKDWQAAGSKGNGALGPARPASVVAALFIVACSIVVML